jgi:hypothetical protein
MVLAEKSAPSTCPSDFRRKGEAQMFPFLDRLRKASLDGRFPSIISKA